MTYDELITALGVYTEKEQPDASFTAATPTLIILAEQRLYRDLDLAASSGFNDSLSTSVGGRVLDLSAMTGQDVAGGTPVAYQWPVVVEGIYAKVNSRWIPFQWVSMDFLVTSWPDDALTAAPAVGAAWAVMQDSLTALLAPPPDGIYPLRIFGQWRPAGISEAVPETWISKYLPDLLTVAVVLEAMIYQRDFSTGGDPQNVMVWEAKYNATLKSALIDEAVKKSLGPGFQPYRPTPLASPQPPAAPG